MRLAQIAQVVVDDRDRDLAQDLAEIGLRVIDAVDQRRHDQEDEGAAHREHAPPFGGKGLADAARRVRRAAPVPARRFVAHAGRDRAQAKEREQRVEHGQSRQRRERARGVLDSGSPRAACPSSTAMYQRNGRIALQAVENAFMARIGKPTPTKPNAGETMRPVSPSPVGRSRTSSCSSAPSAR